MAVKGHVYSQGRGHQESKQVGYLHIHTHKFTRSMLCKGPQFQNSPHKRASMKTVGTYACLWPGLPAAPACLRLAGTQQKPEFNLSSPPEQRMASSVSHIQEKSLEAERFWDAVARFLSCFLFAPKCY